MRWPWDGSLLTENQFITSGGVTEGIHSALVRFDDIVGSGTGQVSDVTPWLYRAFVTLRTGAGIFAGSNDTNAIYQVLKPWEENEVTYNSRLTGTAWGTPGLAPGDDHAATPTDTLVPSTINTNYNFDVTASARDILLGVTPNHGWIIRDIKTPEGTDQAQFYSNNYATQSYRPKLTIETMPNPIGGTRRSLFQQGTTANGNTDATYIYSQWDGLGGQESNNYGADADVVVEQQTAHTGDPTGGIRRTLVRFPDAIGTGAGQTPPGSVVVSARLALSCTDGSTGSFYVNRILQDWNEMEATYNNRLTGTSWAAAGMQAGTDYENIANPRNFTITNGVFNEFDVTAIAQAWADGAANHGILIRSNSHDGATFNSDDTAKPSDRPVLVVDTAKPGWGVTVRSATPASTAATYIEKNASGTNYGSNSRLYTETDNAPGQLYARSLVSFPDLMGDGLNEVPLDADILSATLRLHISNDVAYYAKSGGTHSIHQVLTAWSEGTVTWANFNNGGVAGTDYVAAALDSLAPTENDGFYYFNVTEAVQNWADGQDNYGWMVINDGDDGGIWDSDDYGTAMYRPLLIVQWVPEPSTLVLACLGVLCLAATGGRRRRRAI